MKHTRNSNEQGKQNATWSKAKQITTEFTTKQIARVKQSKQKQNTTVIQNKNKLQRTVIQNKNKIQRWFKLKSNYNGVKNKNKLQRSLQQIHYSKQTATLPQSSKYLHTSLMEAHRTYPALPFPKPAEHRQSRGWTQWNERVGNKGGLNRRNEMSEMRMFSFFLLKLD